MGWPEILSFFLGIVATLGVEKIIDLVSRRVRKGYRRQRMLSRVKKMRYDGALIRRGDECLHIVQFVPTGWESDNITFLEVPSYSTSDELHAADSGALPAPATLLVEQITNERARFAPDGYAENGEWNGPGVAVLDLNTNSRIGEDEKPALRFRVATSDFASARALGDAWEEQFVRVLGSESAEAFEQRYGDPDLFQRPVPGMINAIGLNAVLITNDEQAVLVKRSRTTASGRGGNHISVNEGMLPSDRYNGRLDPSVGILRGAEEELGLTGIPRECVRFHSVIYDVRRYQLGLLATIDLRILPETHPAAYKSDDVLSTYRAAFAKDRYENRALRLIDWKDRAILEAIGEEDWIEHGRLNLALSAAMDRPLIKSRQFLDAAAGAAGIR